MKLKHYLIASPENNYRPWILSKTALVCFCLSIWWLRLFMPGYINVSTGAPGLDPADLMSRINIERTNRFLPPLLHNTKLSAAATIKSQDMIDRDYFAHVNPNGDYVWPVVEAQGYKPYQALGENLAIDFTTPQALVNAWMNSPGHRANIVNEKFEDQGMAAILGQYENRDSYLVTNIFGTLFKTDPEPTPTPTPTVHSAEQTQDKPATPTAIPPSDSTSNTSPDEQMPPMTATEDSTPNNQTDPPAPPLQETAYIPSPTESENLTALKITIGILAALYTIFLVIDSIIIHRARIQRPGAASSPHALAMIMISLANFLTLWF
jgi:uncharacterized protein YkwD